MQTRTVGAMKYTGFELSLTPKDEDYCYVSLALESGDCNSVAMSRRSLENLSEAVRDVLSQMKIVTSRIH